MTDTASGIEWFLARDGQQYGPLSENEMRAFVDLGHLRPTDLIWRAGFPEWRSAPDVFAIPPASPPPAFAPQPVAPSPEPEPTAAASAPAPEAPAPVTPAAAQPIAEPLHAGQPAQFDHEPAPRPEPALAAADPRLPATPTEHSWVEPSLTSPAQLQPPIAQPVAIEPPIGATAAYGQPYGEPMAPPPPRSEARLERVTPAAAMAAPDEARPQRVAPPRKPVRPAPVPVPAKASELDDEEEEFSDAPRRRSRVLVFAAVVLVLGSIAVATFMMRGRLEALFAGKFSDGVTTAVATLPAAKEAGPIAIAGNSADAVDVNFQKIPVWRHIKSEFPEWYTERLQETAKFTAEKRGDGAIAKHLAEAIVTLRRKHADQALTASPDRLKMVATAFLDNLQALAKQNVETCYGFISQGETYPAVLDMLHKPEAEGVQKQMVAVFEAITDGRKAPQTYLPPRKSDYDALAAELNARGWSDNDLRTFSDPRALGRASPEQVCKMVQDWFAAQIALKDPASQARLLVESLRPVVAG